ncbi:MAG: SDR family oxidoreductase [Myxococcales bacterium]|jgi:WW domain-containing oxidoreductase|nr:SDR family oxidoreductase [Myxococcales bacterium]
MTTTNATPFGFSSTAEEVTEGLSLAGKTMVVTGCNSGIGMETARVLALRGAHIIGTARTEEKALEAFRTLGIEGTPLACELSEPRSAAAAARALVAGGRKIDALVCNAGIMALPERELKHGHELQFLTNHLGHFTLVTRALPALAEGGRVVVVSSGAHMNPPDGGIAFDDLTLANAYLPWKAYGQSKLANILFARALAKRLPSGQTANALHPGVIKTNLTRHIGEAVFDSIDAKMMKTVPQGAATQTLLAAHPSLAGITGAYYADCKVKAPSAYAQDEALAERLWTESERIVDGLLRA